MDNKKWRKKIKVGDIINAKDNDDMWYEALIINETKNDITVRFMGWSSKWNYTFLRDSENISQKYTKVPNWRITLSVGKQIDYCSDIEKYTWNSGQIFSIDNITKNINVINSPNGDLIKFNINSPYIAEPYTHCGYKQSPNSLERKTMLLKKRELFIKEKKIDDENKKNINKSKISDSLKFFVNNKNLSDINFTFSNKKNIYAHKIILISRSKYFNSLFQGLLKESNENELFIDKFSYSIFFEIIKYIYTAEFNCDGSNIIELLEASNYYLLDDLKKELIEILIYNLDINNVFDLIDLSDTYNSEELLYNCLKIIFINYNLLNINQSFIMNKIKNFNNNNLKKILKLLYNNIDIYNLFEKKEKNFIKASLLNIIDNLC